MYHTIIPVYNGSFTIKFGHLGDGEEFSLPKFENICSFVFLVIDEEGDAVLVDTGFNEDHIPGHGSYATRDKKDTICEALTAKGYEAGSIATVVQTHLHWDHTGGMRHFPGAQFYVQASEFSGFDHLNPNEETYFCPAHWIDLLSQIKPVNGEHQLKPGLKLIPTGAHSFGHQLVQVETKNGTILLLGDATLDYSLLWQMLPQEYWDLFRKGPGKNFYWDETVLPQIKDWLKKQNTGVISPTRDLTLDEIKQLGDQLYFTHDPRLLKTV
ncbi:MAG: MBL fold metallo-hydrolase [bacterium]|nr:MBL fold metallo-hydrolase [bacterium]